MKKNKFQYIVKLFKNRKLLCIFYIFLTFILFDFSCFLYLYRDNNVNLIQNMYTSINKLNKEEKKVDYPKIVKVNNDVSDHEEDVSIEKNIKSSLYSEIVVGESLKSLKNNNCYQPYTVSKCGKVYNDVIKTIQIMLRKSQYYAGDITGKYDKETEKAIKKYQIHLGVKDDGIISPSFIKLIANDFGMNYYQIKYYLNGGKGKLNNQSGNLQTVINNTSTPISFTELSKKNKEHVGYTLSTVVDGEEYIAACLEKKCTTGKWFKKSELENKKYFEYVYSFGQDAIGNGFSIGQVITFKAKYCNAGNKYDKKTSSCIPYKTTGSNISNFKVIDYDIKAISKQIGSQYKGQCCAASLSYGIFILSDGKCKGNKASAESWAPFNYGEYTYYFDNSFKNSTSMFDKIKSEIDEGRPLVIHLSFRRSNGSIGEHWLTIVGYRKNAPSSKMNLDDIWVINPSYHGRYNAMDIILYNGTATKSFSSDVPTYNNYEIGYWIKK